MHHNSVMAAILDKAITGNDPKVRQIDRDLVEVGIEETEATVDRVAQVEAIKIEGIDRGHDTATRALVGATNPANPTTRTDRGKARALRAPITSRVSSSKTTRIRRVFKTCPAPPAVKERTLVWVVVHSPSSWVSTTAANPKEAAWVDS